MGANTGPFGYTQYYQNINEPIVKAIHNSFIKAGNVITRFPMITEGSLKKKGKRITGSLPAGSSRRLGQEPTNPVVTPVQDYEESVMLWGDNFDIDKALLNDKNYVNNDPVGMQIKAYYQGLNFTMNDYFFNNNPAIGPIADGAGFTGVRYRIADPTIAGNNSECDIAATSSLADADLSAAGWIKFARDIERVLDHMGDSDGTSLISFANPQLMRQINADAKTAATSGGFTIAKDAFDRTIVKFKNLDIYSCGYKGPTVTGAQAAYPVISSSQDVSGLESGDPNYNSTGAVYTSMFFFDVSGGGDGDAEWNFAMWEQSGQMIVKEPVSGTRLYRVMMDRSIGIWQPNTRALGRLKGIKTNGPTGD